MGFNSFTPSPVHPLLDFLNRQSILEIKSGETQIFLSPSLSPWIRRVPSYLYLLLPHPGLTSQLPAAPCLSCRAIEILFSGRCLSLVQPGRITGVTCASRVRVTALYWAIEHSEPISPRHQAPSHKPGPAPLLSCYSSTFYAVSRKTGSPSSLSH